MEEQICIDYNENFLTIAELAKKYGHGTEYIRRTLKENGIHIRSQSENAILKRDKYQHTLQEIEEEVIAKYNEGNGLLKSGKKFNLSPENVKYILKKNNIKVRNYSEAAKISNTNRGYKKNKNFFSVETRDMAWLLGFLAADGTIRYNKNEIKFGLAQKDEEILVKIKQLVNIENPLFHYTTKDGYEVVELRWSCKEHKDALAKYSIVPKKTFILKPPYQLNKKYWIDYIRGYFDGDGSVNLIKNSNGRGNGNLRWQICSANKDFLQWIVDFLYEEYEIPKVKIAKQGKNRKNPLYYFQYSSVSTRKIYKVLYTDSQMFLLRKKLHFEEILSKVKPLYE